MLSHFNHVRLYATLWRVACQAPLSMGFSRQEYWSGLPCPLPGDPPHPGIKPTSLMSASLAGRLFTTFPSTTWEAQNILRKNPNKLFGQSNYYTDFKLTFCISSLINYTINTLKTKSYCSYA